MFLLFPLFSCDAVSFAQAQRFSPARVMTDHPLWLYTAKNHSAEWFEAEMCSRERKKDVAAA